MSRNEESGDSGDVKSETETRTKTRAELWTKTKRTTRMRWMKERSTEGTLMVIASGRRIKIEIVKGTGKGTRKEKEIETGTADEEVQCNPFSSTHNLVQLRKVLGS